MDRFFRFPVRMKYPALKLKETRACGRVVDVKRVSGNRLPINSSLMNLIKIRLTKTGVCGPLGRLHQDVEPVRVQACPMTSSCAEFGGKIMVATANGGKCGNIGKSMVGSWLRMPPTRRTQVFSRIRSAIAQNQIEGKS